MQKLSKQKIIVELPFSDDEEKKWKKVGIKSDSFWVNFKRIFLLLSWNRHKK